MSEDHELVEIQRLSDDRLYIHGKLVVREEDYRRDMKVLIDYIEAVDSQNFAVCDPRSLALYELKVRLGYGYNA